MVKQSSSVTMLHSYAVSYCIKRRGSFADPNDPQQSFFSNAHNFLGINSESTSVAE